MTPDHVTGLRCVICGKVYAPDDVEYVCPDHGNDGILDVLYDYDLIGSRVDRGNLGTDWSMWRYRPLLPIQADAAVPPLTVGWTPMYEIPDEARKLGLARLWVKDGGREPTASFKDRASAIAIVKAQEKGAEVITTASTGNAAAALSGLSASVGQRNVIFVPRTAPEAKIAQLLVFGSTVFTVRGTYDDAFELCLRVADEYGWYNRNTAYNPYMSEGKKTAAYEIAEQLAWESPDAVLVSVGDGCIIGGLHKGFKDLHALGWIDRIPRLIGIQAAGSNYLAEAWETGEDVLTKPAIDASTVADSISAGLPRDRIKAMAAVVETDGAFVTVADDEILSAIPAMARASGVFGEPAGAAAFAGLLRARALGLVTVDDKVVVLNTGSGLKDVVSAVRAAGMAGAVPHEIPPTMDAVRDVMDTL
ncbi:MAG TPA: threonine synthase [Acidimicrobiia bacterium]|nr:threonine synthase [Acidimicrobiia bacterium]